MKKILALSTVLFLGALVMMGEPAPARRFSNPLLGEVVQMTRAGLSDATIVAYVKARSSRLGADVTADDLIRLQEAGVKEPVIRYVAGAAGLEAQVPDRDQEMTYDSSGSAAAPEDDSSYGEDVPYDGYASNYPYWYGYGDYPYYYPYWYAYSPFFSGGFIVRGGFRGGHFAHGGHFAGHGGGHSSGQSRGGHSGGGHSGGGHSGGGHSGGGHSGGHH